MKTRIIQDDREPTSPAPAGATSAPGPDGVRHGRHDRDQSDADEPNPHERDTDGGTRC